MARVASFNQFRGIVATGHPSVEKQWYTRISFENDVTDMAGKVYTRRIGGTNPITTTDSKVGPSSMSGVYTAGGIFNVDSNFVITSTNFTIDFWVKFNNLSQNSVIVDYRVVDTTPESLLIQQEGANLTFYRNYVSGTPFFTLTNYFTAATWTRVTVIREGATLKVYKDGTLFNSINIGAVTFGTGNRLTFGARFATHATGNYGVNGFMDDFKFARAVNFLGNFDPNFDIA